MPAKSGLIVLGLLVVPLALFGNPIFVHWIAYSPSNPWQPGQVADSALVWDDLENLSWYGFQGIVTYGTRDSLFRAARFARQFGFHYVVMGVWIDSNMTANLEGIELAIEHHEDADAFCVGNEALFFGSVDTAYLGWAMDTVRTATGKPVTTSEHWTMYHQAGYQDWFLRSCDFLFPILNPTDNGIHSAVAGAEWTSARFDSIELLAGDSLDVFIKEAGWPTNSDSVAQRAWASEDSQYRFFHRLEELQDTLDWFCFEAYDGWWKDWGPTQPYWGLFDSERYPKLYAASLGIEDPGWPSPDPPRPEARPVESAGRPMSAVVYDASGRRTASPGSGAAGLLPPVPGIYFIRHDPEQPARKFVIVR